MVHFPQAVDHSTHRYWFDDMYAYWETEVLSKYDESFEVLTEMYARNKENIFYLDKKLKNADKDTFQVLNILFAKDKNSVFYLGDILKGADASSFQVLDNAKETNYPAAPGK